MEKVLIYLFFLLLLTSVVFAGNDPGGIAPGKVTGPFIKVAGDFNSRSQNCQGGLGLCSITISYNNYLIQFYRVISTVTVENEEVVITITDWNRDDNQSSMNITDGDIYAFNGAAASALGYESIELVPGTYSVGYNGENQRVIRIPAHID